MPSPPIPRGFAALTAAQRTLARVLRVDEALLSAAAAKLSEPLQERDESLDRWIASLPQAEKDRMLLDLVAGEVPNLAPTLKHRCLTATAGDHPRDGRTTTLEELRESAGQIRSLRLKATRVEAERRRVQREKRAVAARERRLLTVAAEEGNIWREVEEILTNKTNAKYDHAVENLRDLRDVANRRNVLEQFSQRLQRLRDTHRAKHTFISRLDKASLLSK